jgi:uncharacterized protein DUF4192
MTLAASNPPASASSPTDPDETRIRLSSPQDTLAIVPLLLGFHPRRSLAAMALRPPRGRVAFTMRVDVDLLPSAELAQMVAERLDHGGASEVIVVLYDPEHCDDKDSAEPGRELVDALGAALSSREISLREALAVSNDRYRSYLCSSPECCPPEGRPVLGPADPGGPSQVGAAAALAGLSALPDRETLQRSVRPPILFQREAMLQAIERIETAMIEQLLPTTDGAPHAAPEAYRDETVRLIKQTAAGWIGPGATIDDDGAARLIVGLQDLLARDAVIAFHATSYDRHPDRAGRLLEVLHELTRRAVPPYGAHVAIALGMIAYQRGEGDLASVAADRALLDRPDASGAHLLGEMINSQLHPKHVRRAGRQAAKELRRRRR